MMRNNSSVAVLRGFFASFFMANVVSAYGNTTSFWSFNSRPDLTPPVIEVEMDDAAQLAPGYILLTPHFAGEAADSDAALPNGPYIYDQEGNLVYSGYGAAGASNIHNLKVIDYEGAPHLTFYDGNDEANRGHGVLMDNSYHIIKTISSGLGRASTELHEFTVLPESNTAIVTISQPVQYDLSSFGVDQSIGWILDCIFQEIDIATGEVLFEWRSLDHTDPADSYTTIGNEAGDGTSLSTTNIWDYFHLNSVEKDSAGNYLISGRHFSALYYINGQDGSVIWQLNGKKNQFTFDGFGTTGFDSTLGFNDTFAFEHYARLHPSNDSSTVISIMDNGSDGVLTPQNYSSGIIMSLDTTKMTCTLLNRYTLTLPDTTTNISTPSQGDVQLLNNSNVFIGWGAQPFFSEYSHDGKLLMRAQFGPNLNTTSSYRVFKANWTGNPDSTPAIWSTSNSTTNGPTALYASFNGATEVASWKFFGGNSSSDANTTLGTAQKSGFETTFMADGFIAWASVQAIDANGKVLATSPVVKTYVPSVVV